MLHLAVIVAILSLGLSATLVILALRWRRTFSGQLESIRESLSEPVSREPSDSLDHQKLENNIRRLRRAIRKLEEKHEPDPPVHIILAMRKIGGRTLTATLHSAFPSDQIFHVHFLSAEGLSEMLQRWPYGEGEHRDEVRKQILHHVCDSKHCARILESRQETEGNGELSILSGVREPVSSAISAVFQQYDRYAESWEDITVELLRDAVMSPSLIGRRKTFFKRELEAATGIDVFATPFDGASKGFQIYQNQGIRLILIRLEDFDRLPGALSEFYDLPPDTFSIENSNRAADKDYADAYRKIRDAVRFPRTFLEELYSEPEVTHFYTPSEIELFFQRWSEDR